MTATRSRTPSVYGFVRLAGILRARFAERLAAEPWVHEAGLRPPSYAVLHAIAAMQPVSQRAVSDRIGVYPSDLVPVIDNLERLEWVDRERDPDDRRRYRLTLTPSGREALARFDCIAIEIEDSMLSALSSTQREALNDAIASLLSTHVADELNQEASAPRAPGRARAARPG